MANGDMPLRERLRTKDSQKSNRREKKLTKSGTRSGLGYHLKKTRSKKNQILKKRQEKKDRKCLQAPAKSRKRTQEGGNHFFSPNKVKSKSRERKKTKRGEGGERKRRGVGTLFWVIKAWGAD